MKEYLDQIHLKIKSRTKEQWVNFLNDRLIELRSYISGNGELSFIAAFLLGIFVVVFFKVAFAIFFVFALLFAMVWCLADSDIEIRSRKASDAEVAKEPLNKVDENGDSTPIQ